MRGLRARCLPARRAAAIAGTLLLLLAACSAEPPCDPEALTRFEGVWSGLAEGREGDGEWTLLVSGSCFFLSGPRGYWLKGAAAFPEEGDEGPLDLAITECDCPAEGQVARALFRLRSEGPRGEELRIAGAEPGSRRRPASFAEEGTAVLRLRRQAR